MEWELVPGATAADIWEFETAMRMADLNMKGKYITIKWNMNSKSMDTAEPFVIGM